MGCVSPLAFKGVRGDRKPHYLALAPLHSPLHDSSLP